MRGRVFRLEDLPEEVLRAWRSLCEEPRYRSPFYSQAYARAVAEVRHDVRVCVLEQADEIVGVLPFQPGSFLGRCLGFARPVGADFNDFFGLIAAPDVRIDPGELLGLAGSCVFHVENLPEEQLSLGLTGVPSEVGRIIEYGPDPTAYWERMRAHKKAFAAQTDRRERRLVEDHGPLRFSLHAVDWRNVLEHLIAVKREQYRRTAVRDVMAPRWKRRLMFRVATETDPQCTGVLSTVHAGDTWVASHLGLRHGRLLHYWFPVYNIDLRRYSPGHMLIKQIIVNTPGCGIDEMDLGSDDHQHKRSYLTEAYQVYRDRWRRPGVRSAAYLTAERLHGRIALTLQQRGLSRRSAKSA